MTEQWHPEFYGSGTTIVTSRQAGKPHLYVYGPANPDDGKYQRQRMAMCYELAEFLNGGKRPAWLDDMERRSERGCDDLDGSSITAVGPSIDRNPPHCFWVEDDSEEAVNARARLMDRLFLVPA